MLRSIFVLSIIAVGTYYALHGPFYALLFYLWYAYFRPEDWIWNNFINDIPLSFMIGCYALVATLLSRRQYVFNSRIFLLFIFLLHTFLSMVLSEYLEYSWIYWKDFFKSVIITYLIILLVDDFYKFRLTLLVIALSLGFEGAKQGWYYLLTSPGWANPNQNTFLGDSNGVAVGMLMLVPIISVLAQTTDKKWVRPVYWFMLVGVLYRALSTHSRGGFLACLAMGAVYWLHSRHKVRSLLAGGVVVAIVLATLPDTFWNRMQTIQTYEEEEDTSALGRLHFWKVALAMAKTHPFFGVGHMAYNPAYDDFDFSDGRYGRERAVHNSLLGVTAELGYVGLALYILILLTAFRLTYRLRHFGNTGHSFMISESAKALNTSLIVAIVGGIFVTFHYQEMLWHFLGLTFALAEIARQPVLDSSNPPSSKHALKPISPSPHLK